MLTSVKSENTTFCICILQEKNEGKDIVLACSRAGNGSHAARLQSPHSWPLCHAATSFWYKFPSSHTLRNATVKNIGTDLTSDIIKQIVPTNHVHPFGKY